VTPRTGGTATVLFTDLAGSTELMTRLGDLAYDELRGQHFARLRHVLSAHGGVEVKNTGDGILATFGSAADAVRATVAIQQANDGHARAAGLALSVRVGVALGDVTFEDGDVFGTPVVEAARLVAAADSGQILCTAVTRLVAGSRSAATFTDLGPLALKGLPDPVPVCEVAWEPAVEAEATAVPLPPLLCGLGRIFVGREEELDRLAQLWKEAAAGERRIALFGGEPGIGKTRLAAELAARIHADGGLVLAGRCDEDLGVPFQPFVEALRHYVGHAAPPQLGRYGADLIRLAPEIADRMPVSSEPLHSDPETERYRLFDAVAAWLAQVSSATPVLLVLDDLQWAAKPTLLLLRHLLQSPEALRLLVVVTYRDTDIGRSHPLGDLLADLRRVGGVERFPLGGLEREAVGAYFEAVAGHALPDSDDGFVRAVWSETEGNPFFVVEVCRHLTESGAIEERDGRWVATSPVEEMAIPEGVRDVVGRRLSRLSERTNPILAVASVVGLAFEPDVVARAGGFDEDALLTALEEAAAARLVVEVEGRRFRFGHALVRATLYDELSGPRRVVLHRRVAEAIEAVHAHNLDDHLPALAHHWSRAAAPAAEADRAIEYAARAGERALAQLAHDEAVSYYSQAVELFDGSAAGCDNALRLRLLLKLGEAQRRAGNSAFRETLLEAARLAETLGDVRRLAEAALANKRGVLWSTSGVVDQDRVAVLEAALRAGVDDSTRARLLASLAVELIFAHDSQRCFELSDAALALARPLRDPDTLAHVLLARYYATAGPDTLNERLANTAELLTLVGGLTDPVTRSQAWWIRWRAAMEAGQVTQADRALEQCHEITTQLGQPQLRWMTGWARVGRVLLAGCLHEAHGLATEALKLGRSAGEAEAELFFTVQRFSVCFEQGRLEDVDEVLARMAADRPGLRLLTLLQALLYAELDKGDEARSILDRFAASSFSELPRDFLWMRSITAAAAVAHALNDAAAARPLLELLSPYAEQLVVMVAVVSGSVSHYLGLLATTLGHFSEAATHFAAAEATHERVGAPTWLARTRLEWASMLLRRGWPDDVPRAHALLGQARVTAGELGLAGIERAAAALQRNDR